MSQPLFLDIDRVLRIHKSLIEHYGGSEGVRDVGLLQSALAMPQASFGGKLLHADLFETAAAYLYSHCPIPRFHRWEQASRSGDGDHFPRNEWCRNPSR